MYRNARTSHTVQPVLAQLLAQRELVTVLHQKEPAFILLPWSLYGALRSLLMQHSYVYPPLTEIPSIGISQLGRRFLSYPRLQETFVQKGQKRQSAIVMILKWKEPAGALIRYDYYQSLMTFLRERCVSGLEPFLAESPDAPHCPDRLLSLTEFRNLSMRLPHLFAEEQQKQGGDLPFVVVRQYQSQPALVVLSWEAWQRVLALFLPGTDLSQEDCDMIDRFIVQMQSQKTGL